MMESEDAINFVAFSGMILNFWGMWPVEERLTWKLYILHWSHTLLVFAVMLVFGFGQVCDIYSIFGNVVALSENSAIMFTTVSLMCKLIIILLQKAKFKRLLDFLRCDEFKPKTKQHLEIYTRRMKICVRTSKIYSFISIFTLLGFLLFPLLDVSRRLPCPIKYPYLDLKASPMYELAYVFEVLSLSGLAFMNSSVDILIFGFMMQAIAQLDCLIVSVGYVIERGADVGHVSNDGKELDSREYDYGIRSTKACENLKKVVEQHRLIMRYIIDVQDFFNMSMFLQYMVSGVVLCCSGIQMVTLTPGEQPTKLIAILSYLTAMLSEIFMLCWCGNEITDKTEYISEAIYNTTWMDCSPRFKQSVRIFMVRARMPLVVMAGKMFKLNLSSFTTILNSSYSYFALLRHIYTTGEEAVETTK